MGKEIKVTPELVRAIKEAIQEEERLSQIASQKEKIVKTREMIEGNKNVSEAEKKMHMAKLSFQEFQLEVSKDGKEKFDRMSKALSEVDFKVNRMNLSQADGSGVIEIIIPSESFKAFDGMLEASAEYWTEMEAIAKSAVEK